jgi:hypothetical protein
MEKALEIMKAFKKAPKLRADKEVVLLKLEKMSILTLNSL